MEKRLLGAVLAGGLVAAVLLMPQTGWLARREGQVLVGTIIAHSEKDTTDELPAAWGAATTIAQLKTLIQYHPDRPELLASLLRRERMAPRLSCSTLPLANDPDDYARGERRPAPSFSRAPRTIDPIAALDYDVDAAKGEELDPHNAFFPFVRAIGHFANGQNDLALSDLQRAALKPRWNDYSWEETRAIWAQRDRTNPTVAPLAIERYGATLSVSPANYMELRSVVRCATNLAIQQEKAGDVRSGLAIRQALLRVAERMTEGSSRMVDAMTGYHLATIALQAPGGVVGKTTTPERLTAFARYARVQGHPELIAPAKQLIQRGEQLRQHYRHVSDTRTFYPFSNVQVAADLGLMGLSMVCLASLIWVLVQGGLAAWLSRQPQLWQSGRLDPKVQGYWRCGTVVLAFSGTYFPISRLNPELGWGVVGPTLFCGVLSLAYVGVRTAGWAWKARRCQAPASSLIVPGLARTALPSAFVFALLWAVSVSAAALVDRQMSDLVRQEAQDAPALVARLSR